MLGKAFSVIDIFHRKSDRVRAEVALLWSDGGGLVAGKMDQNDSGSLCFYRMVSAIAGLNSHFPDPRLALFN